MKTSLNWIKSLVPGLDLVSDEEYAAKMTLSGTKVESYERLDKNLENIVIGKILKVEKHEAADKLVVCTLDVGKEETITIVTGATNIKVGDTNLFVPVVLDGGKVVASYDGQRPENGIKIKKGKLRGILSEGMMCGLAELGTSEDLFLNATDGIYIFEDKDLVAGSCAIKELALNDTVVEYEITNNRVDCYSVYGIAREVAATFNLPLKELEISYKENEEDVKDYIDVKVNDDELCTRYMAKVVKNVKIKESPKWLQERLRSVGIRPINNVVDITNYVMTELGQPMHAFDYDKVAGKKIIVQRATNTTFTTLDEVERNIDENTLMICDADKEIAIAGIMGGLSSKVEEDTKTVLFEVATFNGTNIRKTSKKVSLRTDASSLFEKGLDENLAKLALDRAMTLISLLEVGEVVGGEIDVKGKIREEKQIEFKPEYYNGLLGTNISNEDMLKIFENISISYDEKNNKLIIPTFRQDLNIDADMAEEVARFFGYDNIPTTLPSGNALALEIGGISFLEKLKKKAMDVAEGYGYSGAITYSFESPKVFDKLLLEKDNPLRKTIKISNPLGEDFSIMRTLPINGMLSSLLTNFLRRNESAALYELARVYLPNEDEDKLPTEKTMFTLGSYNTGDFFDLKGVILEYLENIGIKKEVVFENGNDISFLHPGRVAKIFIDSLCVGYLGEVHPLTLKEYGFTQRVYIGVLDINNLEEMATFTKKYKTITNFPIVTRDVSVSLDKETPVYEIEKIIKKEAGKLLESLSLFDVYEGSQIEAGKKSVAYNISFKSNEKTLTDEDINPIMEKIVKNLEENGFMLRR